MHNLGHTRSAWQPNHLLLTPDTFVRIDLPGMKNCRAIVHAGPVIGAGFAEYTVEFDAGGEMVSARAQRFVYVLEGAVYVEISNKRSKLAVGGYAYVPEGITHRLTASRKARAIVIEKSHSRLAGVAPPRLIVSHEEQATAEPLDGDAGLMVKHLLPDEMGFDFAANIVVYQPGAALGMVEMHVMEHGLMMLEGGGIYRLGDQWYPVSAGDFIWMAPWCPQWFGAIGKAPAKYLVYKDRNRHPLSGARE